MGPGTVVPPRALGQSVENVGIVNLPLGAIALPLTFFDELGETVHRTGNDGSCMGNITY